MSTQTEASTSPSAAPTPTVYVQPPQKKSGAWKWLLAGFGCVFLIIAACGVCGYLMIASSTFSTAGLAESTYTATTLSGEGNDVVAIIDIAGVLEDFEGVDSLLTGSISSAAAINKMIDYAVDTQDADAILFRLNTPGGTLTAAETVCHKIQEVRDDGIYTMSWIQTEGASGGYYIASCTDWIASRQEAITGSIGVVMQVIDTSAFLESIGFKVRTLSNSGSPLKDSGDIFTPGSTTDEIYTEILDEGYSQFVDAVADGRDGKSKDLSKADVLKLADGRVYTGAQAYANGLVDELAYEEEAIASIKEGAALSTDAKVVEIKPQTTLFNSLTGSALSKLFPIQVSVQQPGVRAMAILPTE